MELLLQTNHLLPQVTGKQNPSTRRRCRPPHPIKTAQKRKAIEWGQSQDFLGEDARGQPLLQHRRQLDRQARWKQELFQIVSSQDLTNLPTRDKK